MIKGELMHVEYLLWYLIGGELVLVVYISINMRYYLTN